MNNIDAKSAQVNIEFDEDIAFLDEQIAFHKSRSEQFKGNPNPYRSAKHSEVALCFQGLKERHISYYKKAAENTGGKKITSRPFLSLTQDDLENLPPEQVKELSISSSDRAEFSILSMLENHGGIMSLDQIIVCLYKETQEVQKRATITARLYRMSQKEMIYTVPLKKGVYSLHEISEEEAEKLFKGAAG